MNLQVDMERLLRELDELAAFTSGEDTGVPGERAVTRIVFSPEDLAARAWLKALMAAAGMAVREDAVGNIFARWTGTEPDLAAVGTGSHIDAIPHAGMYDGTVGVLGGLEAIRTLQRAGVRPRRSVDLLMFTSEEPTRFGIGCLGSRLLAGTLDPAVADDLRSLDGQALHEARTAAGYTGPLQSVTLPDDAYSAWVELHIEQGPLLERAGIPIGMVTHIAAPAGYRLTLRGVGGHAGALLMPDRRDALCAASEVILAVESAALSTGVPDTVATVGVVRAHPGAINSVPSLVQLELDLRDIDPARRETVMDRIRAGCREISTRRDVQIDEETINADPPATCSETVLAAVERACAEAALPARPMVSRAYHDSLFMARLAPAAMIFVPCRGGVSHRPDEFASPAAIEAGVRVLAGTLCTLAE